MNTDIKSNYREAWKNERKQVNLSENRNLVYSNFKLLKAAFLVVGTEFAQSKLCSSLLLIHQILTSSVTITGQVYYII